MQYSTRLKFKKNLKRQHLFPVKIFLFLKMSLSCMRIYISDLDVPQGQDSYIRANMLSWDIQLYLQETLSPTLSPKYLLPYLSPQKKPKSDKPHWYCTTNFPDKKYLRTQDWLPFWASLHSPVLKIMKSLLLLLKDFFLR